MPKYEFTEIEVQALLKLIDSGVRHDGLNAAPNAVILMQKLQLPLIPKIPSEKPPEKPPQKPQEKK